MADLCVRDVVADYWGRGGFGPISRRSLPGSNVLSDGVSLWQLSIGLFYLVGGSFRAERMSYRGRPDWA